MKQWLLRDELRLVFSALVDVKRKHPTPEQVMNLFTVRAKRNWRWFSARASDDLAALTIASGVQNFVRIEYFSNVHSAPWTLSK